MEKLSIKSYGLELALTPFTNIIGMPASGKTTLLRILINQIPNFEVELDGKNVESLSLLFKRRNIAVCVGDLKFSSLTVKEELLFYQNKCEFTPQTSVDNLDEISIYFGLEDSLNKPINELSIYEQALIKILSLLIIKPQILGIDNFLSYLSPALKQKVITYAKNNNVSILNITANKEELLLGTTLVILEKHQVKAIGPTKEILENEALLATAGFELPTVASISSGLNYYELLNKKYYSAKTLVGALWK